jgi:hypothetical protein
MPEHSAIWQPSRCPKSGDSPALVKHTY